MKPVVYLADLRYNYSGVVANDCMPLGVAYIKAVMDRDLPEVQSRLFAYPDKLWQTILDAPPDVLMVSNYLWNEELSFHFAKLVKRVRPDTLVVMGGPNIPIEHDRQIQYYSDHPEIDIFVTGEGDFLATEIMKAYLDSGQSISKMGEKHIPSSIYRRPDGEIVLTPMWDRHKEIDDIPSPWLTGIQDEFFDGKLAPMIETNRGCPFSCTFCVQGTSWYTKVNNFSLDRMKEEIEYIARRVKELSPTMGTLRIADSNYGMFERDVELSEKIGEMQKKYGYPTFIDATTGKNRPDRIIRSVEKVSGALVVYQAVQSLNDDVLRNIKRSNIKLQAYEEIMVHVRGRGLRSNSDLIVGLPGETLQSHITAIQKLIDAGTNQMHNLQLVLLKGSELERVETRKEFHFDTRFRVLPKNFGVYGDERVMDIEEIVVSTDTMTFDDYIQTRKCHLVSSIFWNDSWFEDAVTLAQKFGAKRSEWFMAMLPALEENTGDARALLDSFVRETKGELFPTREACAAFYDQEENFRRLLAGDIGDNLMYKYRARASFMIWPEIARVAVEATRRLIQAKSGDSGIPGNDEFWADFLAYETAKHASGTTVEEILHPTTVDMRYDIERWISDSMPLDVDPYKLDEPESFEFRLTENGAREMAAALKVWTCSLKGLTKMVTRIQMAWQVRQAIRSSVGEPTGQFMQAAAGVHSSLLPEQW
ncbi:B12-binding domain-containing radical SAM protein [uncultured Paludibaculum sp.]|uniref:B12-binding domain-containing radical SAM protein n=1 Tax=uncultured Paludibaculum sp. TaxID=1765020 RepID=UPI002AAA7B17|nr:radical SAM protein [uncultured Paludibaculum sp.]